MSFQPIIVGTGFMGMQCLSYAGYIKVNYKRFEDDVSDAIDFNQVSE